MICLVNYSHFLIISGEYPEFSGCQAVRETQTIISIGTPHLLLLPKGKWGWHNAASLLSTWASRSQPTQTPLISALALRDSHTAGPSSFISWNFMEGQVTAAQISFTLLNKAAAPDVEWTWLPLGRSFVCQHVGFCYSVPLQSQWLSLYLEKIRPQSCLHTKEPQCAPPLWLCLPHDKPTSCKLCNLLFPSPALWVMSFSLDVLRSDWTWAGASSSSRVCFLILML